MGEIIEISRWLFYLILVGIAINSWIGGYIFRKNQKR